MQKYIDIIRNSLPGREWVILYIVIAQIVVITYNISTILSLYGLEDSQGSLSVVISNTVQTWAQWLSALQSTAFIITFLVWSVVGLISFILVQVIIRAVTTVYEDEVFTRRYVHPTDFTSFRYWLYLALSWLELIAILLFMALSAILTFLLFMPEAGQQARFFLLESTPLTLTNALAWMLALIIGFCSVHFAAGLLGNRHHLLDE